MKKYIILLILICGLSPIIAQDVVVMTLSDDGQFLAQNNKRTEKTNTVTSSSRKITFESLSDIKGVEVVYISKAMMGMMPNMKMPGIDMKSTTNKLESLQILTAEASATVRALRQDVSDLIKAGAYETLMLTKDGESKTAFYSKKAAVKKNSEIVMVIEDDGEITVMRFVGDLDIKDLKNVKGK